MNNMENRELRKFWNNFYATHAREEIEELNKKELEKAKREFKEFKSQLDLGKCYLCGGALNHFDEGTICLHWLLRPQGTKKNHILKLLNSGVGYLRICSYLRWLANTESIGKNINNLTEEKSENNELQLTVRYKNIEWAITATTNDLQGHPTTNVGKKPHFHFEMRINDKSFIKFNDTHIELTEEDIFTLKSMQLDQIGEVGGQGSGIQNLLDDFLPEDLLNIMHTTDDPDSATFGLSTLAIAKPGETISGNDISKLIKESKKTGVPIGKLMHKLENTEVKNFISPGKGIPEMRKRNQTRK